MKVKDFKSITKILEKRHQKKFYLFQDFQEVLLKIKNLNSATKCQYNKNNKSINN